MHLKNFKIQDLTFLILIIRAMIIFSATIIFVDILKDIYIEKALIHILSDAFILISLILTFFKWNTTEKLKITERRNIQKDSVDIDHHLLSKYFIDWKLTEAEKKVAGFVLVGVSYQGIADLLDKSERTVRQQAKSIYVKSGSKNRSNFTGLFLELILTE